MADNDTNKNKPHKPSDKKILALYGKMKQLIWVSHHLNEIPLTSTHVIIKTGRGLEIAKIVGLVVYKHGSFRWDAERVSKYYEEQNPGEIIANDGELVRIATPQDISEWKHLEASTDKEVTACERIIKELNLDMKLAECEHIFGGERIIFYFTAEGRVDFRELVKRLAKEFQTRIEMRQIGARDEAKILCDFETCGQHCCCSRYLKVLKPVNMRMAKLQKATLDPSKISGYCGRLKCCLRYEDDCYRDLKKKLPNKGKWVTCDEGTGQIVDTQVLTQLVVVRSADGKRFAVSVDEIKIIDKPEDADNQQNQTRGKPQQRTRQNDNKQNEKSEKPEQSKQDQTPPAEDKPQQQQEKNNNNDKSNKPENRPNKNRRKKRGNRNRKKRGGRKDNSQQGDNKNKSNNNNPQGNSNGS